MKQLLELHFIWCVPGPSGDFHYVLLTNPNATVETLYSEGKIQKSLYARFIDRVNEIVAQQDIAALREHWAQIALQAEVAKKEEEVAKEAPPPPLPVKIRRMRVE